MGHRALIGETQDDGRVKCWYSHWGALHAHEAGNSTIEEPDREGESWFVKDKNAFGKEIDYLHHEAVWLDGECYTPIWVWPNSIETLKSWKTKGQGIVLRAKDGMEHFAWESLRPRLDVINDLTPGFSTSAKIRLMVNEVVGHTCDNREIPAWSPLGKDVEYEIRVKLYKDILTEKKQNERRS